MHYKRSLESRYPQVEVLGARHPVPVVYQIIASFASQAQMFAMAALFFGETVCGWLKMQAPDLLKQAQENRMMTFGVIFLTNSMAQGLVNTGAFEISFQDKLVFSKLQEGRLPEVNELIQLLSATK
jgi:selT/selW/selH-like putative selenoprotein